MLCFAIILPDGFELVRAVESVTGTPESVKPLASSTVITLLLAFGRDVGVVEGEVLFPEQAQGNATKNKQAQMKTRLSILAFGEPIISPVKKRLR